jgi:hypothetical protein
LFDLNPTAGGIVTHNTPATEEPTWWQKLVKLDPALVRGFIVTLFGLLGAVLKVTVLTGTVDTVVTFILALFGLVAAVFIRPSVTPNAKVIVADDTPLSPEATIVAGEAVAKPTDMHAVEQAAKVSGPDFRDAA